MIRLFTSRAPFHKQKMWAIYNSKNHDVTGIFAHYNEASDYRVRYMGNHGFILPLVPQDSFGV